MAPRPVGSDYHLPEVIKIKEKKTLVHKKKVALKCKTVKRPTGRVSESTTRRVP